MSIAFNTTLEFSKFLINAANARFFANYNLDVKAIALASLTQSVAGSVIAQILTKATETQESILQIPVQLISLAAGMQTAAWLTQGAGMPVTFHQQYNLVRIAMIEILALGTLGLFLPPLASNEQSVEG